MRARLSSVPSQDPIDGGLQGWWNMFDAFSVHRTNSRAIVMPEISEAEFQQVRVGCVHAPASADMHCKGVGAALHGA